LRGNRAGPDHPVPGKAGGKEERQRAGCGGRTDRPDPGRRQLDRAVTLTKEKPPRAQRFCRTACFPQSLCAKITYLLGCGVVRRYGFIRVCPFGKRCGISSSFTAPVMI